MTPPSRLVILAPNWLGDAVMALPLIADIRRAWPDTTISIAARRSVAPLFNRVSGVANVITLVGSGGWRGLSVVRESAAILAAGGFDAALLLPNSFQAAWIASRAGIPERWGFARDLRARLLTRALPRPSARAHQAAYYQALAAGFGLTIGDLFAQVDVSGEDTLRARDLLDQAGIPAQPFVVFAPGAAYGRAKQWRPEQFAELAALLVAGDRAVVLVGTAADAQVCDEITASAARLSSRNTSSRASHVVSLAGRTDLTCLTGVLALADRVVANDSGVMHLAAAVGARVIAIFGATDERRTAPLRANAESPEPVILTTAVWCRPCLLRECPIDHRCMTGIGARRVFEALALT